MIRTPPSVDWRDIAVKLVRACGTQPKEAKACGVSVSTIAQLAAYSQHVEPLPGVMELAERVK